MALKKIIKIIALIIIVGSCSNHNKDITENPAQKNSTYTFPESNTFIINSFGDTIKTGVALPLDSFANPEIPALPSLIHLKKPVNIPLKVKTQKVPDRLKKTEILKSGLKIFRPGTDTSSFIMRNSTGEVVQTGVQLPAKGKILPLFQPIPVNAQPAKRKDNAIIDIRYFDVEQGLNSAYVLSLLKDKRGNIWLGTKGGGVSMYNGESFLNFTVNEGLSSNSVWCMLEDSKGNIWFGTEGGGVCKYNGKTITHFTENEGLTNNQILCLFEDSKGNIWFGTNNGGATKFDGENFTHYTKKEGLCNIIQAIIEDKKGNLWFTSYTEGIYEFDGKSFTQYTEKDGLGNNSVMPVLEDTHGNLWFGTWGSGLIKYDGENFTRYTENEGLCYNFINSLAEDKKGNIWIGTWEGLSKFDGSHFTNYTEEDGLSYNDVRSILIDNHGVLWLGTWGGGLNIFNPDNFTVYTETSGLSEAHIFSITEDSAKYLWFGSWNGLSRFDGSTFSHYTRDQGLKGTSVYAVFIDSKENIWFGNETGGINRLNNEKITYYPYFEKLNNKINSIAEDPKGNLWFAFERDGLCRFDGSSFTQYNEKTGFPENEVNVIFCDGKGNIWVGTEGGGLIQISDQHITFISSNEGLSDNKVTTIFEDSNQNFWIGTRNGGLNLFDGQSFSSITTSEELVSNSIRSVSEDRNNNLWIGTEIGLNLIKNISAEKIRNIQDWKANLKVLNFGIPDGLTSTEFYLNSNLTDSKNNIWFGTGKSLACLNLNNFRIPDIKPTIQLNRIEINEQFYDFQNINSENRKKLQNVIPFSNYPGSLKLTNHENHLTFYFSAFDPNPLNQVKYSYKIEDLNKEWSIPSTEDKADYRTLPFGNHIFMVRAIGKSQIWSDPIVYYFSISPPWWNTTYAKIAYALILISLFIGLIRLRTNNLHKKQIQLRKQIDERNQQVIKATESDRLKSAFLATMSHEIRTPLNAIIGFSELININMPVEEIVNFSQIINSSGIHLLSIVEDIFDISLIESGQIKLTIENVNLKIIYESVYSIIQEEKKRINKENIEVRLVYPENKDLHVESDLSKLKQILINLLKNALKYTEKGYIEFGYKIENPNGKPYILCYVKDTGIGIPENKKDLIFEIFRQVDDSNTRAYGGVGIGLSISKKLTEILGGKIWVESEINKGSTFFFTIPLNSNVIIVEPTENIVEKNKTLQDITILIAEDDFISYNFLKIILERYGINTVLAKNGREAVEICSEDPTIELVLMDLNMPEMNGYLATEEIKKIRPGLPIIAQTAYAIKGDLQKALDAGCDDYISKPTKRELLIEKIKKSLNIMDEPENW